MKRKTEGKEKTREIENNNGMEEGLFSFEITLLSPFLCRVLPPRLEWASQWFYSIWMISHAVCRSVWTHSTFHTEYIAILLGPVRPDLLMGNNRRVRWFARPKISSYYPNRCHTASDRHVRPRKPANQCIDLSSLSPIHDHLVILCLPRINEFFHHHERIVGDFNPAALC